LRFFTEHPASVGETYFEHLGVAMRFGLTMISGGLACCLHGLLPALCAKKGSETVRALHARMILHRKGKPEHLSGLDYVI
jgi:hypothetical protein